MMCPVRLTTRQMTFEQRDKAIERAIEICKENGGSLTQLADCIVVQSFSNGVWLVWHDGHQKIDTKHPVNHFG